MVAVSAVYIVETSREVGDKIWCFQQINYIP